MKANIGLGTTLLILIATGGCASNSGVVPMSFNTYLISRQAGSGFSGLGTMRVDAIAEGARYCEKKGQSISVTKTTESKPPYTFGNFPRVEIEFQCE